MHRQIIVACLPSLGVVLVSLAVAWLLVRLTRAQFDWRHLANLAGDQRGAVQSLSFVLTVPAFIMILMLIVQMSQITIGKVAVEYSALASARAAQVWIPADLSPIGGGGPNRLPCWQVTKLEQGPDGWGYLTYRFPRQGVKYQKIRQAAVQALVPICPSRDTAAPLGSGGSQIAQSQHAAALVYAPALAANTRIPDRIRNKLAYAMNNTDVLIEFRHKETEPPLGTYLIGPYYEEFQCGEMGWHDEIIITVSHEFALLPGPARLLARKSPLPGATYDSVAAQIKSQNGVHVYSMRATARLYNEGQKQRLGYVQSLSGAVAATGNRQVDQVVVAPSSPSGDDETAAMLSHAGMERWNPVKGANAGMANAEGLDSDDVVEGSTPIPAFSGPDHMLLPIESPGDSSLLTGSGSSLEQALPSVLRRRVP